MEEQEEEEEEAYFCIAVGVYRGERAQHTRASGCAYFDLKKTSRTQKRLAKIDMVSLQLTKGFAY